MLTPLVNENIVATAVDERVPVVQHDDIHASGSEKVCDWFICLIEYVNYELLNCIILQVPVMSTTSRAFIARKNLFADKYDALKQYSIVHSGRAEVRCSKCVLISTSSIFRVHSLPPTAYRVCPVLKYSRAINARSRLGTSTAWSVTKKRCTTVFAITHAPSAQRRSLDVMSFTNIMSRTARISNASARVIVTGSYVRCFMRFRSVCCVRHILFASVAVIVLLVHPLSKWYSHDIRFMFAL
jgi:hypothetical protein